MPRILFIVLISYLQQDIPLKSLDEFTISMDYSFKQRPVESGTTFRYADSEKKERAGLLPYLNLKLKFLKLSSQEVRFKVISNRKETLVNRKAKEGEEVFIPWGFTDDIKDGEIANEMTVVLLSPRKQEVSRILLSIHEDGTFLINGEKRGKF